ncbi:sugar-transfer associated ATP-grasp domain-containing protein [Marinilabilia rubra]|uniref:Hexapeptide transferase n=1 Tax=Marinilabilia rubra TaxID=2162893 RepID=A0A2U2B7F9_9BACT|nr:sugar-transfer associated ATP-grasp domain-containing protein [Marinilabilia rubra]PWD98997.1 hexapeptide transferase [Marinilabilia rubra]
MVNLSKPVSLAYKVTRTLASKLFYLRRDLEINEEFREDYSKLEKKLRVDNEVLRQHRKMWLGWSESFRLPRTEMDLYYSLSGVQRPDFVPIGVYFNTINATINNRLMAWGYAQKGNYARMFDIDNEPLSLFRNLNGIFYDFKGHPVKEPEQFLNESLKEQQKILVKPAVDSSGGKKIAVFERDRNGKWQCLNDELDLNLSVLQRFYGNNYVVQEYVEQHPFYSRFNPSSFNTIRLYVYRSPKDEKPRVMHSVMRIGGKGSVVDNVKAGGMPVYIDSDGIVRYGFNSQMKRFLSFPLEPEVKFSELGKAPGLDDMKALAVKVAEKVPYNRLIAFDTNLDKNGKPRVIELNNYDAGIAIQIFGIPLFGDYTEEVIEYCKSHKKEDILRV